MNLELLDRFRRINKILKNNPGRTFLFNDILDAYCETQHVNGLLLSRKGKVLGRSAKKITTVEWLNAEVGVFLDEAISTRLQNILSTQENVNPAVLDAEGAEEKLFFMVSPVEMCGERIGTLLVFRENDPFGLDDILLAEYVSMFAGLELLRSLSNEAAEEMRSRNMVRSAVATLSDSELQAVSCIMKALEGGEGVLVASKVADQVGITRSVIVNALRKLESAGIIEAHSSGMRGTYIKILNTMIMSEIDTQLRENGYL